MSKEYKKFAWLPKQVTSGEQVWLRYYYEHQIDYDPSTGKPPIHGGCFVWTELEEERIVRLLKGDRNYVRNNL
jgi:hypothetical protein